MSISRNPINQPKPYFDDRFAAAHLVERFGPDSPLTAKLAKRIRELVTIAGTGRPCPGVPIVCEDPDVAAEVLGAATVLLHQSGVVSAAEPRMCFVQAKPPLETAVEQLGEGGGQLIELVGLAESGADEGSNAYFHRITRRTQGDLHGPVCAAVFPTIAAYTATCERLPTFTSRLLAGPLVIEADDATLAHLAARKTTRVELVRDALVAALPGFRTRPGFSGLAALHRIVAVGQSEQGRLTAEERIRRGAEAEFAATSSGVGAAATVVRESFDAVRDMVGLESVIAEIDSIAAAAAVDGLRRRSGQPGLFPVGHYALVGPPGTGKTTVARCIGSALHAGGALPTPNVRVVSRGDLIGTYVGQTIPKLREQVTAALGGVLFIDEAYALTESTNNDYGPEVVSELLQIMERHRGELCVVVAGYPEQMDRFMDSNPGLRSRLSRIIRFPELTADQMVEVVRRRATSMEIPFGRGVSVAFQRRFESLIAAGTPGAARLAIRDFEKALTTMAVRCYDPASGAVRGPLSLRAKDVPTGPIRDTEDWATRRPLGFQPPRTQRRNA